MSWRWNLFDETRHMETHLDERIEGLRARGQSLRYQAYAAGLLLFLLLLAWGWERVEPMRILAPGLWGVILLSTLADQLWQLWHGLLRVPQRKLASISRLGANLTIAGELALWGVFAGLEAYALGWSLRDGLAAALLVMLAVYLLMDCAHNHALRVQEEARPASRVAQFTALAGLLAALAAGVGLLLGPNFGQPGLHITDARIKFLSVALEQEPTSAVYTVEDWTNGGAPALIQFYSYLWEGDGLHRITAGLNRWREGTSHLGEWGLHDGYPLAGAAVWAHARWLDPHTLELIWRFSGTAYWDTVTLCWSPGRVTLTRRSNTCPHRAVTLVGTPDGAL